MPDFELWLEIEVGDPNEPANSPKENFCNVNVRFPDGRRYCLNVWTFDFIPYARYPWPYEIRSDLQPTLYLVPPDLLVESLDRETMTQVVSKLISNNELKPEWLCSDE